jgi:hypothetical protein
MRSDVELILKQKAFQLFLSMHNSCPVKKKLSKLLLHFSVKSYLLLRVIIMETIGLHMVMQHGKMLIPKKSSRLIHHESYCKGGYTVIQDIGRASKIL